MDEILAYGSEEYALLKEQEENLWHKQYSNLLDKYFHVINSCLMDASADSHRELSKLLEDNNVTRTLSKNSEFGYMIIIKQIYDAEIKAGVKHTIFNMAKNMDDLISIFIRLKFFMFELEFTDDVISEQLFYRYVKDNCISDVFIENMVLVASIDRQMVLEKVSKILQMEY